MSSGSAEHRIGLVPCPLCKNIQAKRLTCKACATEGMIGVDRAIEIGVSMSDTERELPAVTMPTSPASDPGKEDS